VNQAAINYHFGGKDGLYREVMRTAFRALTKQQLAHAQEMKDMSRENALGEFIRHQLHPLGIMAAVWLVGQCAIFVRNRHAQAMLDRCQAGIEILS
jgi:AcrR family transcriptional regulator